MFDAESIIQFGGLLIILLAIYAQTGLFFCFFFPSGALLFMAGVLIASGSFEHSFFYVVRHGHHGVFAGKHNRIYDWL